MQFRRRLGEDRCGDVLGGFSISHHPCEAIEQTTAVVVIELPEVHWRRRTDLILLLLN